MGSERDWGVRATAWELLSFSLRYPDEELVQAVASGEWRAAAIEVTSALGAPFVEAVEEPVLTGADSLLHDLRVEATRLFVGPKTPAVSPYEGVWRASDDGVQPLLFVNPHSMAVERFFSACGLKMPEGVVEPLDHAATECELLAYLASLAAGAAAQPGATEAQALPGGSPEAAFGAFLENHAGAWMPRFARALEHEARHPWYRAVGCLLGTVVERTKADSAAG